MSRPEPTIEGRIIFQHHQIRITTPSILTRIAPLGYIFQTLKQFSDINPNKMSDFIPFDIQMEIIRRTPDVTSLIRFRSVSKQWKLFIDSSEFISGFGARNTDPNRLIIRYNEVTTHSEEQKLICLVDDDNIYDALTRKQLHLSAPSIQLWFPSVVGTSNGLFCLFGYGVGRQMVLLWNPCIRRSVGVALPDIPFKRSDFGFGICPITNDLTLVRISYYDDIDMMNIPWQVEVFKLSLGVWKTISEDLPCPTIRLSANKEDAAIGKFIYWVGVDVEIPGNYMVMSFDLVTEKFVVVDIPDSITHQLLSFTLNISKLRDSLVIYGLEIGKRVHGVWKMEHDGSFTKLFSMNTLGLTLRVLAFRMSGEPVIETKKCGEQFPGLEVYDPCSKRVNKLGIHGGERSLSMGSYRESLLLLDYADGYVFSENSPAREIKDGFLAAGKSRLTRLFSFVYRLLSKC